MCSRARENVPTWTALAADPEAWAKHMADCEAVWGGVPLDWSAVTAELGPKIKEGLYTYGGLIDCEPGPGPAWRMKIIQCERGAGMEPHGDGMSAGLPPLELYAGRPALFIFECRPGPKGRGWRPRLLPQATDLAASVIDTLTRGYAANVIFSEYGSVLYGPDAAFCSRFLGPKWALNPTPEQTYQIMAHAHDVLAAVSATASRDRMQLEDMKKLVQPFLMQLEVKFRSASSAAPCKHDRMNEPSSHALSPDDRGPSAREIREALRDLAQSVDQAEKEAFPARGSRDEATDGAGAQLIARAQQ
ncbi:MAG TPA: hypothetical protein VNI01_10085 [Elusimicrobiota bacterium]|jgi:hypothetical protein|nr:hypothetical protein [Elusimicrobiota bacterium]